MIDLNSKEFQGSTIFNNGMAGLVKNVDIRIEKGQAGTNQPAYKVIANDGLGDANTPFYYWQRNPQKDDDSNAVSQNSAVGRVIHVARAVMGADYQFPAVGSAQEAYDVLFDIISRNVEGKKFNVYATYGTMNRPSGYLNLRYFDFIEPATNDSMLKAKNTDNMERVKPDAPKSSGLDELSATNSTKEFNLG